MACIEVFIYKSIAYKKIQPELDEVNCAKENVFFSSTKKLSVCEHWSLLGPVLAFYTFKAIWGILNNFIEKKLPFQQTPVNGPNNLENSPWITLKESKYDVPPDFH